MKPTKDEIKKRIKDVIVGALRLKMRPDQLKDDLPLFGGELGLDSIDALEIVVAIEKEYGLRLDEREARNVLDSVETIASYIMRKIG